MRLPESSVLSNEEQRRLYDHDLHEFHSTDKRSHTRLFYFSRFDACVETVRRFAPRGLIADIGCAQGNLALHLAEQGRRVVAVDLRASFLGYMRTKREKGTVWTVVADARHLPLRRRFSAAILVEVVEHMAFPEDAIRQIASILTPGGILCVTTPNGDRFRTRMPTFSGVTDRASFVGRQFQPDADGHLFYFTGRELRDLVERLDLEVVDHQFYGTPWLTGRLLGRLVTPFLSVGLLKRLDRLTRRSELLARKLSEGHMLVARCRP